MKKLARLWFPLLVFLAFLSALFSSDLLVKQLGENVSLVARNTFIYGVQIGVWLSAALLLNRIIELVFWDGFVGTVSGRKVPRLPKDVTALSLFILAGIGVTATVFDKSITGILATSGIASIIIGLALRNIILDMFIGLAIHVERPFKIGDWIQVHRNRRETHIIAMVIEINWRTTRLRTTENNMIVVPNNVIGTSILTN
ncbi:MAG: mechanosensitive ion channel, partial [Opitutae bacterium]|nr:mechanosensitive ion channel [Opitutae bacterium]